MNTMKLERKLSNEEMELLTKAISAGESERRVKQVLPYDFSRAGRLTGANLRAVHAVFYSASREWQKTLSNALRTKIELRVNPAQQMAFRTYCESISSSDTVVALMLEPVKTRIFIDFPVSFAKIAVDKMTGGSGEVWRRNNTLTQAERNVLKCLIGRLTTGMSRGWKPVEEVSAIFEGMSDSTGFSDLESDASMVIISMVWKMDESEHFVNAAIPAKSLNPVLERLDMQIWHEKTDSKKSPNEEMAGMLKGVDVAIHVDLGRARVSVRDVLNMDVGDVVRLDRSALTPVDVLIAGKARFKARPGLKGKHVSVQITDKTEDNSRAAAKKAADLIA